MYKVGSPQDKAALQGTHFFNYRNRPITSGVT